MFHISAFSVPNRFRSLEIMSPALLNNRSEEAEEGRIEKYLLAIGANPFHNTCLVFQ